MPSNEPTAPICPYTQSLLHVVVQTDMKADENILKIKKVVNGVWKNIVRERDFQNDTLTAYDVCMDDDDCVKIEMIDSGNDGICCGDGNGYYKAFYKGNVSQFYKIGSNDFIICDLHFYFLMFL